MKSKIFRVIGLMSGTSIDGIDAAIVETDGLKSIRSLAFRPNPYDDQFRSRLRQSLGNKQGRLDPTIAAFECELTHRHADIVHTLLKEADLKPSDIDLIGFHGQTIWHQPQKRSTIQIGDGALLAQLTEIPVINEFRIADVEAGGHGAPMVPLYHRALSDSLPKPVMIVNIGGVSNISWIGGDQDDEIIAFDIGPGNALIDDWMLHHTGKPYDEYGSLAATGQPDEALIDKVMGKAFFRKKPPKSLDRDEFKKIRPDHMNAADGAATLTMITARAVAQSLTFLPQKPLHIYVTGGGRLNKTLMNWIRDLCAVPVGSVDDLGWSGDGLEAEAFAYLAVRSKLGLPLSVPGTTGVPHPMLGGKQHNPI